MEDSIDEVRQVVHRLETDLAAHKAACEEKDKYIQRVEGLMWKLFSAALVVIPIAAGIVNWLLRR